MKTVSVKLYNSKRNRKLKRVINAAGLTWNHLIALYRRFYRLFKKQPHKFAIQKLLTKLKKLSRFSYMSKLNSQALQDVVDRINRSYTLFFSNLKRGKKCSPPSFRKVKKYKSFTLKQSGFKLLEGNSIEIQKQKYRFFKSREIQGKIHTLTIKRDSLGDIYLYFVVDSVSIENQTTSGEIVGLDFGLKTFLTTSDGERIESPLFFNQNSKLIRKAHRRLSRKKKGSKNREKALKDLARIYKKSVNQREDFQWKLARSLCQRFEIICIEDLNIVGMKRIWGRKISDLSFSSFVNKLEWMSEKFGVSIRKIDRFYASSQICSKCGYRNSKTKDLSVREWECPECGAIHDRDINAAINILKVGATTFGGDKVRLA